MRLPRYKSNTPPTDACCSALQRTPPADRWLRLAPLCPGHPGWKRDLHKQQQLHTKCSARYASGARPAVPPGPRPCLRLT
ncbi:hypothetical protein NDU88_004531 [Pleurodeles waltl]|uniref:Uncharacterized protein n=1 Tax=Pleurodeles waltl TaxID=8319 RepID=A0AAV7M9H6_PLEWA|nr:hypothetical protein NDU88_004531 [Pleurodeles waltl]